MITDVAYQERYYGSTIEPLTKRMIHHKHKFFFTWIMKTNRFLEV